MNSFILSAVLLICGTWNAQIDLFIESIPDGKWPASKGKVTFASVRVIPANTVFDGGMKTYERSDISCKSGEGSSKEAVFLLRSGATLKNAIIGAKQVEGVHCEEHDCLIQNVWWDDVCEDALTILGGTSSSVTRITGGGAKMADDKIIQHNGPGKVIIKDFYANTFGKLYRSCGSCPQQFTRSVEVSNVYAVKAQTAIVGVNSNYNDKATLSNIKIQNSGDSPVCQYYKGAVSPKEATLLGSGPKGDVCKYDSKTITRS